MKTVLSAMLVLLAAACASCGTGGAPAGRAALPAAYADLLFEDVGERAGDGWREARAPDGETVYLRAALAIPGTEVRQASIVPEGYNGMPEVVIVLAPSTEARLEALTAMRLGRRMALTDGRTVLNVSTVASPFTGTFRLTGLSREDAARIHRALQRGP